MIISFPAEVFRTRAQATGWQKPIWRPMCNSYIHPLLALKEFHFGGFNDRKVSVLLHFGAVLYVSLVAISSHCLQCLAGLLYDV